MRGGARDQDSQSMTATEYDELLIGGGWVKPSKGLNDKTWRPH
jgi:hypothetical protein